MEQDGITISSTYIRTLVAQGEMERAVQFLGHPHILTQQVNHGKGIGHSALGFPTVNLRVPEGVIVPATKSSQSMRCIASKEATATSRIP